LAPVSSLLAVVTIKSSSRRGEIPLKSEDADADGRVKRRGGKYMARVDLERDREKERIGAGKKRCWRVRDYLLDSELSVQFTLSPLPMQR